MGNRVFEIAKDVLDSLPMKSSRTMHVLTNTVDGKR